MGKFTEFKLQLKTLPQGEHSFEYRLGKQFFVNMESADIHDADLHVGLSVVVKADVYQLHFTISGTITLLCDRCLDSLLWPIDTTYDINVKFGDDYNDEADDFLVIPFSNNYLNVAYMLYDTVALAIPIKHVHAPGKCNRQMTAMLRKHKASRPDDPDAQLEEQLMDEMDSMEADVDNETTAETDPRWDALKNFNPSPDPQD